MHDIVWSAAEFFSFFCQSFIKFHIMVLDRNTGSGKIKGKSVYLPRNAAILWDFHV